MTKARPRSSRGFNQKRPFTQFNKQNKNKNNFNKTTEPRPKTAVSTTVSSSSAAATSRATKRPRTAPSTGNNSSVFTRHSSIQSLNLSNHNPSSKSIKNTSESSTTVDDSMTSVSTRRSTVTGRPGTATGTAVTADQPTVIMALAESRGTGCEIGVASLDLQTSACWFLQVSDTPAYARTLHQLMLTGPDELVIPDTLLSSEVSSKLLLGIEESLGAGVQVIGYQRRDFQHADGRALFERYATEEALLAGGPLSQNKYYALAALAALISYVNENHSVEFCEKSLNIQYHVGDGLMTIDSGTAKNLELVSNIRGPSKTQMTLFSSIKHTQTHMGTRLLRSNLLQPLADQKSIELRLDAVDELLASTSELFSLKSSLKNIAMDVDYLITALIRVPKTASIKYTEQCINNVLQLRQLLLQLPVIIEPLKTLKSGILSTVHQALSSLTVQDILDRIGKTINEDLGLELKTRNQRIYAVKAGFNGLLDVARQTFSEVTTDIHTLHQQYLQEYSFPVKLQQAGNHVFLLTCSTIQHSEVEESPIFINITKKRKTLTFTTLDLLKLNERLQEALTEIYLLSDDVVQELMADIRNKVAVLYKISESVALLDMLVSFAHYATKTNPSCRPEFEETLAIKQGKHPIRAAFEMSSPCIPNDTYAYNGTNFQIVTGPNMSGKSTYLRQVALLNILAHIGCYVPAEYASFRVMKQLMSRLSNDDSIATNSSTFMTEMRDMSFILQNISESTLVIVDELGRGTSTYDALGITCALCEKLISSSAIVFFATHFMDLVDVLDIYPNVVNLHLRVEHTPTSSGYKYLYKVESGPNKELGYGLNLARQMKYPQKVLVESQKIFDQLNAKQQQVQRITHSLEMEIRKVHIQMLDQMLQGHASVSDDENLKQFIQSVWHAFTDKLRAMTI